MSITILQYVLIVTLVLGTVYFFYLLKEKCVDMDENYYGINYLIFDTLEGKDVTKKSVKNILRIVSENVCYVEVNYNELINEKKEELALSLIKEELDKLNIQSLIREQSIRNLIRLCCALNNMS